MLLKTHPGTLLNCGFKGMKGMLGPLRAKHSSFYVVFKKIDKITSLEISDPQMKFFCKLKRNSLGVEWGGDSKNTVHLGKTIDNF